MSRTHHAISSTRSPPAGAFGRRRLTRRPPSPSSPGQADLQNAVTLYGIAKGIAQVAKVSDPSLAPAFNAGIAKADPIVAKALVVQIQSQERDDGKRGASSAGHAGGMISLVCDLRVWLDAAALGKPGAAFLRCGIPCNRPAEAT